MSKAHFSFGRRLFFPSRSRFFDNALLIFIQFFVCFDDCVPSRPQITPGAAHRPRITAVFGLLVACKQVKQHLDSQYYCNSGIDNSVEMLIFNFTYMQYYESKIKQDNIHDNVPFHFHRLLCMSLTATRKRVIGSYQPGCALLSAFLIYFKGTRATFFASQQSE